MSVNVIRLLYKLHISGVRKAEEWLPFSLLMHCRNTSEYNFIKTTVLDKLQEYDRRYQSSLLDTLSAALRENSLEVQLKDSIYILILYVIGWGKSKK